MIPETQTILRKLLPCAVLAATLARPCPDEASAAPAHIENTGTNWILENDVLRANLSFANGSIELSNFFGKQAHREYLSGEAPKHLFYYGMEKSELYSNDGGWTLAGAKTSDIFSFKRSWGKQLEIILSRVQPEKITVRLRFEIYDGRSGLRYQTFVRNGSSEKKTISRSDVIALNFPNDPHVIHMCPIVKWYSTTGPLAPNAGLNAICVYESGDGWALQPEVNWKTAKLRPESGSTTGQRTPFAHINAWSDIPNVKVATNPESLQLVLFPGEEFEYIGVNLTLFQGDIIDGRMAMQEHFHKRFKYHDVTSVFFTNDWDWLAKRTDSYYRETVIPLAKRAGLDMIMLDDFWNADRDSTKPKPEFTKNLAALTDHVIQQGMRFGLWFCLNGGGHNEGRDLADPKQIEAKFQQMEKVLIPDYHVSHQMIDLTEFWPNDAVTSYSHPSDNVYRKNVLVRNYLNKVVQRHPEFVGKLTNEVDIFPTRGDRTNGLIHICDNGFIVTNGGQAEYSPKVGAPMKLAFYSFGYMPMESVYFGGQPSVDMSRNYTLMLTRFAKFNSDPATWDPAGIEVLARFNRWRKSARIRAMTEEMFRPVMAGTDFNPVDGPYSWMYVTESRNRALLLATAAGRPSPESVNLPIRWLDREKQYLIAEITMLADGNDYAYAGSFTGAELRSPGLTAQLSSNPNMTKVYWLEEDRGAAKQVIYADEAITNYREVIDQNKLTVTVQGLPNTQGKLIIYDRSLGNASTVNVDIRSGGAGTVSY